MTMTTTEKDIAERLADGIEQTDDRSTVEHDGLRYEATVVPDYDALINDYECYGKVSYYQSHGDDYYKPRPEGFTGRAHKIDVDRGGFIWWEPNADLTDAQIAQEKNLITDLVRDGFYSATVTISERLTDSLGRDHWVQVAMESLHGIDCPPGSDYMSEVISNLVHEANYWLFRAREQ